MCNGPAKRPRTPRKKVAIKAAPAQVKQVEIPDQPVVKKRATNPEKIALHRALEAFAEHDMLRPETYRKYPDIHPPKSKTVRRR